LFSLAIARDLQKNRPLGAWRPSPLNWERLGGVFTSP
jgi:hypothetical protein